MIYNYLNTSTLDIGFNDKDHQLIIGEGIKIDEILVRRLKEMDKLFKDAQGCDPEMPLYYMYNGIYREEHEQLFKEAGIKYEYTLLLPDLVNGECIKAHGHVHGISPITKTNYLEIYEVLGGEGYFQLFRIIDKKCEVILLDVKAGDFVIIPPGYYHLSINTGDVPFNFGDLIVNQPNSDYGLLKEYEGAPYYFIKDKDNQVSYQLNNSYKDLDIELKVLKADEVMWDKPIIKAPLYSTFVANPKHFEFLK